ncbi:MAG: hypothetical protein M0P91_00755 [Sulfuricurvum sp.]|uniref:hypothetical protein n=1 Tax=Sulfuricurvum sp. TaxID=2025608 RepID=UPI0025FB3992|nr:hypothetical protein [Sulfuricurvum sp.]MCK9371699.1 hypothetical protein [Sulfuricurvum sp.]
MRKFSILWASLILVMLGGCSAKHYSISEPKMIVLKTKKIKFADMGYLRHEGDAVEVEIFTAGVAVEKISIDAEVCTGSGCMSEEAFAREYLYEGYPADTMRNILLGRDIFNGQGKSEICNGTLYQYIRNEEMDFVYRRKPSEIYFRDYLNGIMIKIADVKENNATE